MQATNNSSKNIRRNLLARVHILKKQAGISDLIYRDILAVYHVESSALLDKAGLRRLIKHLEELPKPKSQVRNSKNNRFNTSKPAVPLDRQSLMNKIEALLAAKGSQQGKSVPWSYARAILKRLCGVDSLNWATPEQLHKVVAALMYDAKRYG